MRPELTEISLSVARKYLWNGINTALTLTATSLAVVEAFDDFKGNDKIRHAQIALTCFSLFFDLLSYFHLHRRSILGARARYIDNKNDNKALQSLSLYQQLDNSEINGDLIGNATDLAGIIVGLILFILGVSLPNDDLTLFFRAIAPGASQLFTQTSANAIAEEVDRINALPIQATWV